MARTFTISYPDELYEKIQGLAKKQNMTISEAVREAVTMYLKIDPVLLQSAKRLAAGFGIEPIEVMQNMAIRGFAENQAHIDVYGMPLPELGNKLFAWESDQARAVRNLITGDQLYQNLKQNFVRKFEAEWMMDLEKLLKTEKTKR